MIALALSLLLAAPAPTTGGIRLPAPGREDGATAGDPRKDAELAAKREQLIQEGTRILPLIEGERKAELIFQLAELYWEKAQIASLAEVRKHDDQVKAWLEARDKDPGSAGPEPRLSTGLSDGLRKNSLSLYTDLLRDYPAYARRDEVLFVKGYAEAEVSDGKSAVQTFRALVREYPHSRYVPDAWIALGEHYFRANDLEHARDAFTKARAFRLPKIYAFATYKLAWCDYNAGDYPGAIAKFHDVIAYADADGALARDRVQLRREALKDLVLSYARQGDIEEARRYLIAKGGDDGISLVERLASTFFDDGKFDRAIEVYKALEAQAPSHPRAPSWQQRIVLAYDKLDHKENVLAEAKRLAQEYAPASGWAKANAKEKGALQQAGELGESALRDLVQDYHQEAVKTKSAATYRIARDMYRQYLEAYPEAEAATRLRFYYAEILWSLEEWEAAAEQYGKVAEADPKGEFAPKAAYDAILALEKVNAQAKGKLGKGSLADDAPVDERRAKGEADVSTEKTAASAAPEALGEIERKLAVACDRYVSVAKGAQDEVAIRYKAAYLFYAHRQDDEASRRFKEIVAGWPQDAWARKAMDLALDVLDRGEKWEDLVRLAETYRKDARLAPKGSDLAQRLEHVAEGGRFKHAMELYEKKRELSAAAAEFEAFAAQHPKSSYAAAALNNAMVIAEKSDRLDAVQSAATRLLREHPDADEQVLKAAALSLASAAERTGRFVDAASRYEEFASKWPEDARASDRLSRAALWREALGDDARAAADWQSWLDEYGDDRSEAPKVAFALGAAIEKQKAWPEAAAYWSSFIREYPATAPAGQLLMARYKQALALQQMRYRSRAEAAFADVARRFALLPPSQRLGPAVDAAAHARFVEVEKAFKDFEKIRFDTTSQRTLVARLREKNKSLAGLLRSYAEVLKLGSPRWSAAALTRIGQAHRSFNKGLLDAPMPRGLDAEEQDLYRQALESKALPLENKAVEAFRKAIETGERSGVYTEWAIAAQDALRELQPDAYQDRRDTPYLGGDARTAPAVGEDAFAGPVAASLDGAPEVCRREPSPAVCAAALDAHPDDPRLLAALAEAQRARGSLADAEATVRTLFLRRAGGATKAAARLEAERGRTRLAESLYARARAEDASDPALPNELGILSAHRGDAAAARAFFLQATTLDPGFAAAWANLGALLLSYRDYTRAHEAFAKALELDPDRAESHLGSAWALEGGGKMALARAQFDEVLRLLPGEIDALYGRAAALRAEGQLELALRAFREYVTRPNATRLKEAKGNIAAIELRLKSAAVPAEGTAPAEEKKEADPSKVSG